MSTNIIAATTSGNVDFTQLQVVLNNKTIPVLNYTTYTPSDTPSSTITYFLLESSFEPGSLVINAPDATFNFTLPAVQYGTIVPGNTKPISDLIYGANFPTDGPTIQELGITLSRWGGNAETAYNPFGDFTNAGNDWYFENRDNDDGSADDWIGWVQAAGSSTIMLVPALDWVAKDNVSYSYPATVYPDQSGFDPYNSNAGSGLFPNGSYVTPVPPQDLVYTPWNASLATTWLKGLQNKPTFLTVDNEIEIASNTHQDMHPIPIDYDEELQRVITFGTAAKAAVPGALLMAPSTDSWWYYWTSTVGWSDTAAHDNIDFIPWFLQQMAAYEKKNGTRLLDYLDIHGYFQADTSANDAAAKALRLRMTRGMWDPSYIDESWLGVPPPQNHQPNGNAMWLIPRFIELIEANYPGTKFSMSEWTSSDDTDITGGLVTVDCLGIFGVYGVDAATYWATPDPKGPIGLAFWLYRGFGTFFGDLSVPVYMSNLNPDLLGVYSAKNSKTGKISLVIVNKDLNPVSLAMSNVPAGAYLLRHFGGLAGEAKWQTIINLQAYPNYLVVPSYVAVHLLQQ